MMMMMMMMMTSMVVVVVMMMMMMIFVMITFNFQRAGIIFVTKIVFLRSPNTLNCT